MKKNIEHFKSKAGTNIFFLNIKLMSKSDWLTNTGFPRAWFNRDVFTSPHMGKVLFSKLGLPFGFLSDFILLVVVPLTSIIVVQVK